MNKVILMGRLTRDPEVRYTAGENALAIARYTLAVDRRFRRDGEATADFISCVVFGRGAEFAEKYFHQGIRIVVSGRIQTGSYTNREGQKVYTTEVVVEEQEFAESKSASDNYMASHPQQSAAPAPSMPAPGAASADGFMNIPDGIDEDLNFENWKLNEGTYRYVTDYTGGAINNAINDTGVDIVLYHENFDDNEPSNEGKTLYVTQAHDGYIRFMDDTKVVFEQMNNNEWDTFFWSGESGVARAIRELHDANATGTAFDYTISAVIEDGRATTIIIRDEVLDGDSGTTPASDNEVEWNNEARGIINYIVEKGNAIPSLRDLRNDVVAFLDEEWNPDRGDSITDNGDGTYDMVIDGVNYTVLLDNSANETPADTMNVYVYFSLDGSTAIPGIDYLKVPVEADSDDSSKATLDVSELEIPAGYYLNDTNKSVDFVVGGRATVYVKVAALEFFEMQDFGAWGDTWPGAYNVGWKYLDGFDTGSIIRLEVGMRDSDGDLIVRYTASGNQLDWQYENGYITSAGLSSAPFYQNYNGTDLVEGADDDWTVEKGSAFDEWTPATCYVTVTTANGSQTLTNEL